MFKGALVGFGEVAEKAHAPAFAALGADFEIAAVADGSPARLERARAFFPQAALYAGFDELLQKESRLDFADIATPPHLHAKLAQLALQHRLHALVEKPLSVNARDLESLKALASSQNRSLFTVHNWKHAPLYLKAAEIVASKVLGDLHHAELHVLRDKPASGAEGTWRVDPSLSGGGILVDHGWHAFYLLAALLGQEPRAVTCRLQMGPRTAGAEEEATALIEFSPATAVLHLTWRAGFRSNWGLLIGRKGTLEMRDDRLLLQTREGVSEVFEFPEKLSASSAHQEWFKSMLSDFKAELVNPKVRGRNLKEAEICLGLLTHAYQSHRLGGKSVSLPAPAGRLLAI